MIELPKIGNKYKLSRIEGPWSGVIFECVGIDDKNVILKCVRYGECTAPLEKFWDNFYKRRFTKAAFE